MVKVIIKTKNKRGAKALKEVCQLLDGRVWTQTTPHDDLFFIKELQLNKRVPIKKIDLDDSKKALNQAMQLRGAKETDFEVSIYE